ncbi:hypothetical protein [Priestia megaterium]|nr:hypothetical protein [Priestia megaterium]
MKSDFDRLILEKKLRDDHKKQILSKLEEVLKRKDRELLSELLKELKNI